MAMLDAIRSAVRDAERRGVSQNRIAVEAGLSASQLCRLMSGERGLAVNTVEILADRLGLEIIVRPKRRRRKGA